MRKQNKEREVTLKRTLFVFFRKTETKKMMNTLQAFKTTLTPNFHVHFIPSRHSISRTQFLCLSKSGDGTSDSDSDPPKPEGDTQKQELLARIAMLQTSKVRLTDFLDERSDYLTKFVEEANAEFDKVGEDAMKDLNSLMQQLYWRISRARCKLLRNVRKSLGLIGIVVLAIADSFLSSPDWRKVAILGAVLIPLLTQFVYEQTLLVEEADKGKGSKKD